MQKRITLRGPVSIASCAGGGLADLSWKQVSAIHPGRTTNAFVLLITGKSGDVRQKTVDN